jgi:hypothetical protein
MPLIEYDGTAAILTKIMIWEIALNKAEQKLAGSEAPGLEDRNVQAPLLSRMMFQLKEKHPNNKNFIESINLTNETSRLILESLEGGV